MTRMTKNIHLQAAALGLAAAMRSMSAPLALTRLPNSDKEAWENSVFSPLASSRAATVLPFMAAGEMVGDKLPFVPNRTNVGPLMGRIGSGGIAGAALFAARNKPVGAGAAIGALAAFVGTFAAFNVRKAAGQKLPLPGWLLGIIEDAGAYALALNVLRD